MVASYQEKLDNVTTNYQEKVSKLLSISFTINELLSMKFHHSSQQKLDHLSLLLGLRSSYV